MKILHINTADAGGAAIATIRLHLSLLKAGIDSTLMTLHKSKGGIKSHVKYDGPIKKNEKPEYPTLTFKNLVLEKLNKKYKIELEKYNIKLAEEQEYQNPKLVNGFLNFGLFSYPFSQFDITNSIAYQNADIIHLHWVAKYLDYESFFKKNKKPVVWTLHDANPFRGGFHHEDDEIRNISTHKLLDEEFKLIKKSAYKNQKKMTIISPSSWLKEEAIKSNMFEGKKITRIANGIDLNVFKPRNKEFAREFFSLDKQKTTFLVASHDLTDYRKGIDLLLPILKSEKWKDVNFVFAGSGHFDFKNENIKFLGGIQDEKLMALVYNSCDFFLLTSRTDNLPNTMLEAMASEVPVIGFPIGDNIEIFGNNNCGIVCENISSEALEKGMIEAINKKKKLEFLRSYALDNFCDIKQADLYIKEYHELLID